MVLPRSDFLSRRALLKRGGGVALAVAASTVVRPSAALADGTVAPSDVFVNVFLRGGMDGLNAVAPGGDPAYYAARPGIAVPASSLLPLDRTFGLHPALAPLLPAWAAGDLAIVHAVGNPAGSRSHFDAQDAVDCGVPRAASNRTGWLGRHLASRPGNPAPLRTVAVSDTTPLSLLGAPGAVSMRSIDDFGLQMDASAQAGYESQLRALYGGLRHPLAGTGRATLAAVDEARRVTSASYTAATPYPDSDLGKALQTVARCALSGTGIEAATVDVDDWDMHTGLGNAGNGRLADKLGDLAHGLAALRADLGSLWATTTVAVVTEFGRRLGENGDGGVDHGHGGVMLVLGGGIRGGTVYGSWPGLAPGALDQGDLAVTTDWRDVYAELVTKRLGNGGNLGTVFPGLSPAALGLAIAR